MIFFHNMGWMFNVVYAEQLPIRNMGRLHEHFLTIFLKISDQNAVLFEVPT